MQSDFDGSTPIFTVVVDVRDDGGAQHVRVHVGEVLEENVRGLQEAVEVVINHLLLVLRARESDAPG